MLTVYPAVSWAPRVRAHEWGYKRSTSFARWQQEELGCSRQHLRHYWPALLRHVYFYRAMHVVQSAVLSVRPSVTLMYRGRIIRWTSSKIITRIIS